ncbi:MAG: prohibitin family protein [Candidatus Gracilibacteria bacterium]|jgi:regulator of protease activity HflC (stomatin/prohibitin superfamily)|nr:prohibitin family protein [Candidatus Gracilibacteria bacterium]
MRTNAFGFKKIVLFFVLIIVAWGLFSGFGIVPAGYRGVHLRFSAVTGKIFNEGLYFKIPFIEDVKLMSIKIVKMSATSDAASSDLQTVASTIAVNYHLEPSRTAYVYQNIGRDYESSLIAPAIQEIIKATSATFTAEQLITKRTEVREAMKKALETKLSRHGVIIDEFNIENFQFSESFNVAVEAKVSAEQQALAAKNKLEQIKFEAQQKIESAKGSAEAIRIESEALFENPAVLQLRAIEKWDGVLPKVTGEAVPFINVLE